MAHSQIFDNSTTVYHTMKRTARNHIAPYRRNAADCATDFSPLDALSCEFSSGDMGDVLCFDCTDMGTSRVFIKSIIEGQCFQGVTTIVFAKLREVEWATFGVYIMTDKLVDKICIDKLRHHKIIHSHRTTIFLQNLPNSDLYGYAKRLSKSE
jgi:hypothetical protein